MYIIHIFLFQILTGIYIYVCFLYIHITGGILAFHPLQPTTLGFHHQEFLQLVATLSAVGRSALAKPKVGQGQAESWSRGPFKRAGGRYL